jgi:uncharacterized protein YndB with AHSA1/START domain
VNETLRTVDGRAVLRMERRLKHPPEKVWRALTEPAQLSQWYPFPVSVLELRVGGRIGFSDGESWTSEGVIIELDPPRVFAFDQVDEQTGHNLLRFELRREREGCLLAFTHTFGDRPHAAANAAGWQGCLDALDMVLDGRPVEVAPEWVERHEAYLHAFGLDAGSVEATPDGWRVRFERQLMQQPVDAVWAALNERQPAVGDPVPQAFATARVAAGPVTAVEAPRLLEYDWRFEGRPAGRVRWELSTRPAGARITLTQTGPSELPEARSTALAAWQAHIDRLAKQLHGRRPAEQARPTP